MDKKYVYKKLILTILAVIAAVVILAQYNISSSFVYSPNFTLKTLSMKNNVKLPVLIKSLKIDKNITLKPDTPLTQLGVGQNVLEQTVFHIKKQSALKDTVKYSLWTLWLTIIMLFIVNKKGTFNKRKYLLLVPIVLFGITLGGMPAPGQILLLFVIFSLMGNKFFCSWGCHLGALQEFLYNIPIFKKKYNFKVPFVFSLIVRITVYFLSFALMLGWVFNIKHFMIYKCISYFSIYDLHLQTVALILLPVFLLLCFFTYRPYCHYICGSGLISWITERFCINRMNIDREKCVKCKMCTKVCPTEAMNFIYDGKASFIMPDCWSCAKCQTNCKPNAIKYD